MQPRHLKACLFVLLATAWLAWAKEEIIPTKPKARQRHGPQNPLHDVADDMDTAARRLKEAKTDDTTQETQETIIKKLELLIEQARQQSQRPPKGGQSDSKKRQQQKKQQPKPASKKEQEEARKRAAQQKQKKQTSRPGIGRPGSGTPDGALHTDAEEWGNLPPSIREQLLQTQGEGFPLKYRELLRRYYRELFKPRE